MCYLILGLDQHFAGKTIVFTPCGIAHLQPLFGQRPYAYQRPCQGRREAMYGRLSGLVGQVERSTDRQAELADCSEQAGILPLVGDKRTGLSLLQIALGRALMADWTSEQVAQLREYFNAGLTASAIAEQTGRTRNSVIGKVARIGLAAADRARKPRPLRLGGVAARSLIANAKRRKAAAIAEADAQIGAFEFDCARFASSPAPGYPGLPLLELARGECRYPIGPTADDPRVLFWRGADNGRRHELVRVSLPHLLSPGVAARAGHVARDAFGSQLGFCADAGLVATRSC